MPLYLKYGIYGFIMDEVSQESLNIAFEQLLKKTPEKLQAIAQNGHGLAYKFTYDYYYRNLQMEVFS
jgi:hypothetical protein